MRSHHWHQSTWSSWRQFTRRALEKSGTRTSTRRSRRSHVFHQRTKGTSTFFLSKIPPIGLNAWELPSISCLPGKEDMKTESTGVEKYFLEEMFMSMSKRSLSPAVRPRATGLIQILSTNDSCPRNRTLTDITCMCRCSSTSGQFRPTTKLPIDMTYTAATKVSTLSLPIWPRAL